MRSYRPLFLSLGILVTTPVVLVAGDQVYQYQVPHNAPLFTDKKLPGKKLVTVKYYGRPPAYPSCRKYNKMIKQHLKTYMPHIREIGNKFMVDTRLIKAIIIAESCFDPNAVSSAGAQGLMQLMPATARFLGVTDPFDPAQNIEGGVSYLRMMLDQFHQNKELALAAYNAGPEAVRKYGRIPPYPETQKYVRKIIKML